VDPARAAHLIRQPAQPPRVSIEEIARLVGHASTRTTEIVYRRELRPVITTGAEIMDQLFTGT
jgi:integrase